jgi:hypothetical protein
MPRNQAEILRGTGLVPIDIHTPLWLWSRSGFTIELQSVTTRLNKLIDKQDRVYIYFTLGRIRNGQIFSISG